MLPASSKSRVQRGQAQRTPPVTAVDNCNPCAFVSGFLTAMQCIILSLARPWPPLSLRPNGLSNFSQSQARRAPPPPAQSAVHLESSGGTAAMWVSQYQLHPRLTGAPKPSACLNLFVRYTRRYAPLAATHGYLVCRCSMVAPCRCSTHLLCSSLIATRSPLPACAR